MTEKKNVNNTPPPEPQNNKNTHRSILEKIGKYVTETSNKIYKKYNILISIITSSFPIILTILIASFSAHFSTSGWSGYQATTCTIIGIIYTITFLLYQYGHNNERNEIDDNLEKNVKAVENTVKNVEDLSKTMPPEAFLSHFAKTYELCYVVFKKSTSTKEAEQLEKSIRLILNCIITLLDIFEKTNKGVRYAANIMLPNLDYKDNPEDIQRIDRDLYFKDLHDDPTKYLGVLELNSKLSVESDSQGSPPDSDLKNKNIILWIPHKLKTDCGEKYQALPCAPVSFLDRKTSRFRKTKDLGEWLKKNGNYKPTVIEEVIKSFQEVKNIESFMSIPIFEKAGPKCAAPTDEAPAPTDEAPIAILNIHCNMDNMLQDDKQLTFFEYVMSPFFHILSDLLRSYLNITRCSKRD